MKTRIPALSLLAGAMLLAGCSSPESASVAKVTVATPSVAPAANAAPTASRVQVVFENPAGFTDVKSSPSRDTDAGYLKELQAFIERDAPRSLAEGEKLVITFTDIDMAGDFEPWRSNAQDVRMVKSLYPPRATFTWKVTDASGAVVREGTEHLNDMTFQSRTGNISQDDLFYEKGMLGDWMRVGLRGK